MARGCLVRAVEGVFPARTIGERPAAGKSAARGYSTALMIPPAIVTEAKNSRALGSPGAALSSVMVKVWLVMVFVLIQVTVDRPRIKPLFAPVNPQTKIIFS